MVTYNYAQLEYIWIQAGGSQQWAPMAAAISMAESGGNSNAISPTNDYGLWQINASAHPSQATLDVMGNARAAVAISNGGTNWRPWCTAWCPPDCNSSGHSTYEGSCAPYQKYLSGGVAPSATPVNATNAAANNNATLTSSQQPTCQGSDWIFNFFGCIVQQGEGMVANVLIGIIRTILNPIIQIVAGIFGILAGITLVGLGIIVIVRQSETGRGVTTGAATGALEGAILGPEGAAAGAAAGAARGAVGGTRTGSRMQTAQARQQPRTTISSSGATNQAGQPTRTVRQTWRRGDTTYTESRQQVLRNQAWEYQNRTPTAGPAGEGGTQGFWLQ